MRIKVCPAKGFPDFKGPCPLTVTCTYSKTCVKRPLKNRQKGSSKLSFQSYRLLLYVCLASQFESEKKICFNQIDKTDTLMTNDCLMKVVVLQNAPLGAFCITFDLR